MNLLLRDQFLDRWNNYFPSADLPITFYYSENPTVAEPIPAGERPHCLIAELGAVRKGKSIYFDGATVPCMGGKRFLGFSTQIRPGFRYFLSCGIEGEIHGERYKKSPELVDQFMANQPTFEAPAKFIVFKRIDRLEQSDAPLAAVFFARPDVLSGLFTLANFDEAELDGVYAPFGAGCSSIVARTLVEAGRERPRAVLGMFDVTARPHVPADMLTFAVPWKKFETMIQNMDESFLTTAAWGNVQKRIAKAT
jgi:uncharacterized protein (DUF169 family)